MKNKKFVKYENCNFKKLFFTGDVCVEVQIC